MSTVILPARPWNEGGHRRWQRAEELGFHAAYTYDHLMWRSFRDRPWFGTVPTLAAAAALTERIRLGPLVTSPNFRHPVTLAKELMTLDDISGGRVTLGVGAGASGFDSEVMGNEPWTSAERSARFGEFLALLDKLLTEHVVTCGGTFYSAHEAHNIPGCVQEPRLPFVVAATGRRGMEAAARHGRAWVTLGDPRLAGNTPEEFRSTVAAQIERLDKACVDSGRAPDDLERILLTGFTGGNPMESVDSFVDFAGSCADMGFAEIVVHWPEPDSVFAMDGRDFERITTEGMAQLRHTG